MAQWLGKKLRFLKFAMETKAEDASRAAMEHPASILQEVEKVNISVGIYIGELTLDMNSFREAQRKLDTDNHHSQDMHKEATQRHINDVRAAQDHYLRSQIVLEEAELASGSTRAGKWVERVVGAAHKNLKRLSKVLRVSEDEIAVVNIWPLNALGTFKKQVVDRMKVSLTALPGVTLVFLTLLPSDTHTKVDKKSSMGSCHDMASDMGKGSGSWSWPVAASRIMTSISKKVVWQTCSQRLMPRCHPGF